VAGPGRARRLGRRRAARRRAAAPAPRRMNGNSLTRALSAPPAAPDPEPLVTTKIRRKDRRGAMKQLANPHRSSPRVPC
jgi:hypothetical protein